MRYTHDPQKLAANVAKHGVWFDEAQGFEWDTAIIKAGNATQVKTEVTSI